MSNQAIRWCERCSIGKEIFYYGKGTVIFLARLKYDREVLLLLLSRIFLMPFHTSLVPGCRENALRVNMQTISASMHSCHDLQRGHRLVHAVLTSQLSCTVCIGVFDLARNVPEMDLDRARRCLPAGASTRCAAGERTSIPVPAYAHEGFQPLFIAPRTM